MSDRTYKLVVLAFAALAAGGCGQPAGKTQSSPAAPAPEFALRDLSGRTVHLADLRGKVLLLDFWATWCGPCHESIPFFEALYEKHHAHGLEMTGINEDVDPAPVPQYVRDNHMTYQVLLDPENKMFDVYSIRGIPATFLLDRQGRIRARWIGFDPDGMGEIEAAVKTLLDEKGV